VRLCVEKPSGGQEELASVAPDVQMAQRLGDGYTVDALKGLSTPPLYEAPTAATIEIRMLKVSRLPV
jgi:hypothetical protein